MPETLQFHQLAPEQQRALEAGAQAGLFVQGEDLLRITSLNSDGAIRVAVVGRMLALDGVIRPFSFDHVPNTDRTAARTSYQLADGWLLSATCVVSNAAPIIGQTWLQLEIVRGAGSNVNVLATLASGYATAEQRVAWPASKRLGTLDGRGAIRSIVGTDPAAGANILETVPTGAQWRLMLLQATLVTDATVATRNVFVQVDDGTNILYIARATETQVASLTVDYNVSTSGFFGQSGGNEQLIPFPHPVLLRPGYRLQVVASTIQVGDNWSAPRYLIEEWLEGA